jgi:hypothetical protein
MPRERVKVGVVGWWYRRDDVDPLWEEDTPYMSEAGARKVFRAAFLAAKRAYQMLPAREKNVPKPKYG